MIMLFTTCHSFAEKVVLDSPELAGISGFRQLWDQPIVLKGDGLTRNVDKGRFGSGPVADWTSTTTAGAAAFDAVHRQLLLRFPQAAKIVHAKLQKGHRVESVRLILPFRNTEYFPMHYDLPNGMSFLGKLWVKNKPRWHAMATPILQPWQSSWTEGPTFNASQAQQHYWHRFGARTVGQDRLSHRFGPTEVSEQSPTGTMDLTSLFQQADYGSSELERWQRFSDCGLSLQKQELYDAKYWKGGYEWGVATGHRAILIKTPQLEITFSDSATDPQVSPLPNIKYESHHQATATVPSQSDYQRFYNSFKFKRPSYCDDTQWQRLQELFNMGGGKSFPSDYKTYLKWLDHYLSLIPRAWKGFSASEMSAELEMYREAIPEAMIDNVKLYWTAWLMPDRQFKDLVQGYVGGKLAKAYYEKTKDWRGNFSVYRTYCHVMGTTNFNSWATTGALFGGSLIEAPNIIQEARRGYDKWMTRTWTWKDGSSQESLDHYYLAHTVGPLKTVADLAPNTAERLAAKFNIAKHMDELISCFHPQLRRFISSSGRTGIAYPLYLQEGLQYVLHSASKHGTLTDMGKSMVMGRKKGAFAKELPAGQVAVQATTQPWVSPVEATMIDQKPFPQSSIRSYSMWGQFSKDPLWKVSYLGHHYGMASIDRATQETVPFMIQWNRKLKPAESYTDLGTLLVRAGYNDTEFLDSIYHDNGKRNPNGIVGVQGGATSTLQSQNTAIVLSSPSKDLNLDKKTRVPPQELKSLQTSVALFNFEDTPQWKIYVEEQEVTQLPHTLKAGQRITIHDGVSYLGILPLPSTKLGQRDREVVISTKGEVTDMQGGGKAKVTLTIDNFYADAPQAQDIGIGTEDLDKAVSGFIFTAGDVKEHQSFQAFQKHFLAQAWSSRWNSKENMHQVSFGHGDQRLDMSYQPLAKWTDAPSTIMPRRSVGGQWPYLTDSEHRRTSTTSMNDSGLTQKLGASLKTKSGSMAMLQVFPKLKTTIATHPFQERVAFQLTTPEGAHFAFSHEVGPTRMSYNATNHTLTVESDPESWSEKLQILARELGDIEQLQVIINGQSKHINVEKQQAHIEL